MAWTRSCAPAAGVHPLRPMPTAAPTPPIPRRAHLGGRAAAGQAGVDPCRLGPAGGGGGSAVGRGKAGRLGQPVCRPQGGSGVQLVAHTRWSRRICAPLAMDSRRAPRPQAGMLHGRAPIWIAEPHKPATPCLCRWSCRSAALRATLARAYRTAAASGGASMPRPQAASTAAAPPPAQLLPLTATGGGNATRTVDEVCSHGCLTDCTPCYVGKFTVYTAWYTTCPGVSRAGLGFRIPAG
jgi:hypothetical protein